MKRLSVIVYILIVFIAGCAPRDNFMKKIADEGNYYKDAAIINTVSIEIDATNQYVWDLMIDVPHWPDWNPAIPDVRTTGLMYKGDNFAWKWGKKVYTSVHYFDAAKKLVWFSKSMAYRSIMAWEFEALPNNKTRVSLTESRDGFYVHFTSAKKHKLLLETWLQNLKNRAEVVRFQ